MKIIEQFSISKTGNLQDCEDQIFFNNSFAAVIDGATTRNEKLFDGKRPGLAAALVVKNALGKLKCDFTLKQVIDCINEEFHWFYKENNLELTDYTQIITASAVIFSKFYNQIWMVGDCQCLVNNIMYTNTNDIDDFVASVRSFINQAEFLKGKTQEWIMNNDPGAEYIKPLLSEQFLFQNLNSDYKGLYKYTAFDGRTINENAVKIITLDNSAKEIILASDGYPIVCNTLMASEDALDRILKNDPLRIYEHKGVKGVKHGFVSFDDRAYLRFAV